MAFFMLDDMCSYVGWRPDSDVELQGHVDLRDGNQGMGGIGLLSLASDTSVGQEIGIARRLFPRSQGWHIGWRTGGIKSAVRETDRLPIDCRGRCFPCLLLGRMVPPPQPDEDEPSEGDAKQNRAARGHYCLRFRFSE